MIQAQLSDSLDFLASRTHDTPVRHRTMQAALEWSYGLLPLYEQNLLVRLAVCANGFGIEAAHAVGADTESRATTTLALENLVNRSFLRVIPTHDGSTRFEWLHTLRLFALSKLAERGDTLMARNRHAYYYVSLANIAETIREQSMSDMVRRLSADHTNLQEAATHLLANPVETQEWSQGIFALVSRLNEIAQHNGQIGEARERVAHLLTYRDRFQTAEVVRILIGAMTLAMRQNDLATSDTYGQEAKALAEQTHDPLLLGLALSVNATLDMLREDFPRAIALGTEAAQLQASLPMGQTRISTLQTLAIVYKYVGQYDEAFRLLDDLLYHARTSNDKGRLASVLINIGSTYTAQADYQQAEPYYHEALQLAIQSQFRRGIVGCISALAQAAYERQQHARAVRLFGANHAHRLQSGFIGSTLHHREEASTLADIRQHLSPIEFNQAWYDGMGMSENDMVQYALAT